MVLSEQPPEKVILVCVSEAPERDEEQRKRVSQLFQEILERENILSETHFTNTSFWSIGPDERPGIATVRAQKPRLLYELAVTRPRAILALGKTAAEALIPGSFRRGVVENVRVAGEEIPVFATWHPAFVFRVPEMYLDIVRDVQRAIHLEIPREADGSYVIPDQPVRFVGRRVTLDTETENTLATSKVVCAAVTDEERTYLFDAPRLPLLRESLAQFTGRVIAHNASFDEGILRRNGVQVTIHHDTMLLHLALDGRRGTHSLKTLSPVYGNRKLLEWTVTPKEGAENVWEDTDPETLYRYCAADARGTRDLYDGLVRLSDKQEMRLYQFLRRAGRALAEGMYRGILIDRPALRKATEEETAKVQATHDSFPFDPDSPRQVVDALRAEGYNVDSSAEPVLHRLTGVTPKRLLEYREQSKNLKAFLLPLDAQWTGPDNTVHPRFLLHGTGTGRLSAQDPNVQQISPHLRHFFIARPGHQFITWDLKSAEVRAIAYFSQDERLIEMLRAGLDPHQAVADATGLTRQQGKTLVFASVYGAGTKRLMDSLGVDQGTVFAGLNQVEEMFPGLKAWKKEVIEFVTEHGYVETPFGRKIAFPYQEDAWRIERQAVNALPQSLGSDVGLVTLIRAYEMAKLVPLITVHDSVVLECPEDILDTQVKYLKEILQDPFPNPYVRFEIEMKVGPTWGNLEAV